MNESVITFSRKAFHLFIPNFVKPVLMRHAKYALYASGRFMLHGFRDLPTAVEIETNSYCNRTCLYCPRPKNNPDKLDTKTFQSIIEQLREAGFHGIIFPHSYNEPLTDERIPELISYTHARLPRSKIVLSTNGDLLNKNTAERLFSKGLDAIRVTLHDPCSEDLEHRIKKLRDKYRQVSLIDFRDDRRDKVLSTRGGLVKLERTQRTAYCREIDEMVIRADGNVVLCGNDARKSYVFGNVKYEKVLDIWQNSQLQQCRREIRKGKFALPICLNCEHEV